MDLTYKRQNAFKCASPDELKKIFDYNEGYKKYLDNGKTERETVTETIEMAKANGYKEYRLGDKINKGDKLYYNNRGKALFIIKAGKADLAKNGIRILVAHVDSPRLDLKQVPLYESSDMAFLKTHYYGGIKKYQWLALPLALHGVISMKDGSTVNICIGEDESDPVFYITDLLPHLSQEYNEKTVASAFKGENLNVLIGGMPMDGAESNAVKMNALKLLNEKYGITEEDFLSAEIEAVPALKAKDVGFDRAFVASYGHDDRVCAYPSLTALVESLDSTHSIMCILADKEETGSNGVSGMQSEIFADILAEVCEAKGANYRVVKANSKCLSADVNACYDPMFADVYEKQNSSILNHGAIITKYTGSRGKSGTSDASAEFMGAIRKILNDNNVTWQTGELGKVDQGGGGTVAQYIAKLNIDVVDLGVPVLSMHAPYEVVSKVDIYETYRAICAFNKH